MPHVDFVGSDGKPWPSATQLTNLLPQSWLWAWFHREVKAHGWRGWQKCKATSKRGMTIGSEVHGLIEGFIKQEPFAITGKYESQLYADRLFDEVNPKVQEWIAIEPHLVNKLYRIHGTADAIVMVDNHRAILDWKTSAGKSETHPIQLAIYAMCWNEEHPKMLIDLGIIARIDKKSKKLGVKLDTYDNLVQYYPVIRALREVWEYSNA